jgi:hypothetical protein
VNITEDSPCSTATFAITAPTSIKTKASQPIFGAANLDPRRMAEAK